MKYHMYHQSFTLFGEIPKCTGKDQIASDRFHSSTIEAPSKIVFPALEALLAPLRPSEWNREASEDVGIDRVNGLV